MGGFVLFVVIVFLKILTNSSSQVSEPSFTVHCSNESEINFYIFSFKNFYEILINHRVDKLISILVVDFCLSENTNGW